LAAWLAGQPSPDSCSSSSGPKPWPAQLQSSQHSINQSSVQQNWQVQQPTQQHQQQQAQLADVPGYKRLVLFSLNDYMGLSTHPDVKAAAAAAAQQVGYMLC
jgi:7-keto-8-aminopelargonate synthetase-like enzyme